MRSNQKQTASSRRLSAPPTPTLKDSDLPQFRQVILNGLEDESILCLFNIAESISRQAAEALFGKLLLTNLLEAGLLGEEHGEVFSYFHIQTYKGLLFLSDYSLPQGIPHDLVLPIGPSGKYLEAITIREKVDTALDLGCGCGLQTLLLAAHSTLVTATDINKRCLSLTALNARLNSIHNIELLEGSYFEPVRGRKFDLIVSNTPYVITPGKDKIYRDAKGSGDEAVMNVIQQTPEYLHEGGYAHILATWLHKKRQSAEEPLQAAVNRLAVDTLLIYEKSFTPTQYAHDWVYDDIPHGTPTFYWTWLQWIFWYQRMGMERFAFGSVTLQKRTSAENWFRLEIAQQIAGESAGDHIYQLFLASGLDVSQLDIWDMKLIPSHLEIKKDAKGEVRRIEMKDCLVLPVKVSPFVGDVIGHFDGKRTLRQAWEIASSGQTTVPEKEADVLHVISKLIKNGYIAIA
jgi:SAM-dependent methyltransferase